MNLAVERKPLRADAARNVDKIINAARECFRQYGPDVPLQTIAATAGVGPATLFRNFSDKEQLVLAALNRQLRLHVDPVIDVALAGTDAADGLFRVIDAVMSAASDNANLLGAVAGRRDLLTGITGSLIESVGVLLDRGQDQGTLRVDISLTDMVRLLAMLIGVVDTMEPGSDAWRRPAALVEDAVRAERPTRPLPAQVPLPSSQFE
ncbi:putative TetR family transcriptional regulator [Arthrobacter globiformis NBRC 12137]|uniref:Putative TetR family transcriptional regulator n=1 Tax=Arthrobacter globiformis (strain ATCC 8010 / DSM 20124 / JCM 1332 / NBRC 12137 / NCIMB 8907 / NRRL B-2979 / 168) TaxID=1077972 RepID=H0QIW6_ARTG1|nr:TetR/AcrR family transcriptional regulator [Arthrobacter globiformis]GAB12767.1 putative TetR family transcriptional regulator [Arthrobacter globiformis NBRC 12137]